MKLLLRLYAPVAMLLGLGMLVLLCLFWLPFALLLYALPLSPRHQRKTGRFAIFLAMRFYLIFLQLFCLVRINTAALAELEGRGETRILIANHPSLLDAVIFLAYCPNAVCVMKSGLQHNLLYGAASKLAHYVDNANPMTMIRNACEELKDGAQLILFPEGTRTRTPPFNPLGIAAAVIARRANVPVQVVLIDMDTPPYLGKSWPLLQPPTLPLRCTLRRGPCLRPPHPPSTELRDQMTRTFNTFLDEEFEPLSPNLRQPS